MAAQRFMMFKAMLLAMALLASGCMENGYRDESGKIILGPTSGDDPIYHKAYPSYAEYSVATHELDLMAHDGWSHDQQVCFAQVMLDHFPSSLRDRLNDYATGRTILMESQFAAMTEESKQYATAAMRESMRPDLETKCGMRTL